MADQPGATFILMYAKQDKPQQPPATLRFFGWAYANGDKRGPKELDYVACRVEDVIRQQ